MKAILAVCLLFLVSSIHLQEHQRQTHENAVSTTADTLDTIAKLAKMFTVTCSKYNFKRQSFINVANSVRGQDMIFDAQYISSGQIAGGARQKVIKGLGPKEWKYVIPQGMNLQFAVRNIIRVGIKTLLDPEPFMGQYDYTKKGDAATGSNGVISFSIKNQKVVIFYQNPWSGWPGAGICVMPSSTTVNKAIYDKMYDDMRAYAKSQKSKSKPNTGLYNGCLYFQNVNAGLKNFNLKPNGPSLIGGLQIQGTLDYKYVDDCYVLNFGVNVRGQ